MAKQGVQVAVGSFDPASFQLLAHALNELECRKILHQIDRIWLLLLLMQK